MENLRKLRIENTDVFLEDIGENQGKVTISNTYGYNYSYYWGSMGGNLSKFIKDINGDYFASNLLGTRGKFVIDVAATFSSLRKHIREEVNLYWWQHMEFQKDMRKKLRDFQSNCEDPNAFVDGFFRFVDDLDFGLIKDKYDAKHLKEEFKNISEPWHFIVETESPEYNFLCKLHKQIKEKLKKEPVEA